MFISQELGKVSLGCLDQWSSARHWFRKVLMLEVDCERTIPWVPHMHSPISAP